MERDALYLRCSFTEPQSRENAELSKPCAHSLSVKRLSSSQGVILCGASGQPPSKENRADSTDNVSARSDNHGHWIRNRVASKAARLLLSLRCAVNHADDTARGFGWLPVGREIPKAPNSVRKLRQFKATGILFGFLFATRLEPKLPSIQI